jgi:hypothetical protein
MILTYILVRELKIGNATVCKSLGSFEVFLILYGFKGERLVLWN